MKDLLSKDLSSFVLINSASCKIYYHKYIFGVLHNFVYYLLKSCVNVQKEYMMMRFHRYGFIMDELKAFVV